LEVIDSGNFYNYKYAVIYCYRNEVVMAGRPEKYAALRKFLEGKAREFCDSGATDLPMSFKDIEALGARLPPSAHNHRAWWSNDNGSRPWDGTFRPKDVDLQKRTLNFQYVGGHSIKGKAHQRHRQLHELENERPHPIALLERQRLSRIEELRKELNMSAGVTSPLGMSDAVRSYKAEQKKCHPAFGSMRGLIRVVAGTDLTEPAADPKSWKLR
jgi:hypothetical protein